MRLETWYLTPGGWSCGTVAQDGDERFVEAPAERAAIVQVARLAEGEVAREPTVLFRDAAAAPQLEARFGQWPPGVAPASAPSRVARGAEDVNPSRAGGREAIALALRCWLLAPALALAAGALALPVAAALLAGTPRQLIPGSSSSGAFGYLFEIGQSFAAGFEGLIALLAVAVLAFFGVFAGLLLLFLTKHRAQPGAIPWSLESKAVLLSGAAYLVFGSGIAGGLLAVVWEPLGLAAPFLPALSIPWWMARDRRLIAASRATAPLP